MEIQGFGGRVLVGYERVASVGRWTLTAGTKQPQVQYHLSARTSDWDAFWGPRGPHDVTLVIGKRLWSWKGVTLDAKEDVTHTTITGQLDGWPLIH